MTVGHLSVEFSETWLYCTRTSALIYCAAGKITREIYEANLPIPFRKQIKRNQKTEYFKNRLF